jgi:hypothetical protein
MKVSPPIKYATRKLPNEPIGTKSIKEAAGKAPLSSVSLLRPCEGNRAKGKIAEGAHYVAGGIRRQGEREGMSDSGGRQRFKKERKKDIRDTWKESKIDSGTVVSNTIMYRCTLSHVEQTAGELGT